MPRPPFPGKADVDPVDFSYVLGYVTLVDVEHDPRRYHFRLDGSILVEMSGTNYTGRYLDELGAGIIAFVKETYDRVVDSGLPYRYRKAGFFDQQQSSRKKPSSSRLATRRRWSTSCWSPSSPASCRTRTTARS